MILARTDILAGKGNSSLRKSVHGGVHKALQIGGGRVARHHHGAEGVDGGLDDHVGKAEHRALQPGRQANKQDLLQRPGVEGKPPQVQPQCALFPDEHSGHQQCGHGLTDDGSQRHARHTHGKADDKDQIQHHVDDTGSGQTVQRALGVAHGPQQRTAKVVQHGHGHSDKINFKVQRRKVDHILRAAHQLQQAARSAKAHHRQQHAADQAQRYGGVHRVLHALFVPGAKAPGCHHVGTQRKPDEQVDKQVDQRAVGANGGQRRAARKAPYHHNIGGIEQQLQNAGCRQRHGKQDDLLQHGSAGQVCGTAGRSHELSTSYNKPCVNIAISYYSAILGKKQEVKRPVLSKSGKYRSPGTACN